jgi:hypothetical protein
MVVWIRYVLQNLMRMHCYRVKWGGRDFTEVDTGSVVQEMLGLLLPCQEEPAAGPYVGLSASGPRLIGDSSKKELSHSPFLLVVSFR